MAASYPASLKSFTTKTNYVDLVDASHVNDLQDEVVAVETELGTDVAGSAATLKSRLAISIADDGSVQNGTDFPGSPVANQLFRRTDLDTLYQRNAANDGWSALGGVADYADGSLVECTAATERTSTESSYTKIKEFSDLIRGGTISVTWEMKTTLGSSNSSRVKVYINGVATGVEQTTTSNDYVSKTDTGITVSPGDIVQLYSYADAGVSHSVRNASILCANPTTPQEASGY